MKPDKQFFTRFFKGEATEEEERILFRWLNEDFSHAQQLISERKEYDLYLVANDTLKIPEEINIDEEYRKLREYIENEKTVRLGEEKEKRKSLYFKRIKYALSYVAVIIGCIVLFQLFFSEDTIDVGQSVSVLEIPIPSINHSYVAPEPKNCKMVSTRKGNKKEIRLPDNTRVWINSKSNLKYLPDFNGKLREVWLEGEAFFEVAHDSTRQFIVHTKEFDVKVYGTSFNVFAYEEYSDKSYTLLEGSIRLTSNIGSAFSELALTPGQQAKYESGQLAISEVDPLPEIAWKEGKFYFKEKGFPDICRQLEHAFNVTIHIEGENLKKSIYTGEFVHNENLTDILSIMSLDRRLEYERKGDLVIIREK